MYFGLKIKELRESNDLFQRQLATILDIDTPMLSKIERGERKAKRHQVITLAKYFRIKEEELISIWLSDKIYEILKDESLALEALKVAEETIEYERTNKNGRK